MRVPLALAVIVLSTSVSAQTDNGFFRPTPNNDPSLTNPPVVAPRSPEPFLGRAPAAIQVVPVQVPAPATTAVAEEAVQKAEAETARAQREAEEAARSATASQERRAGLPDR